METISVEPDETNVGGDKGEGVGDAWGGVVSVRVGVNAVRVDVADTEIGEGGKADAVDCGCSTFTWNEQALVNNKTSRVQFLFMV
jgi:hypothetical protein